MKPETCPRCDVRPDVFIHSRGVVAVSCVNPKCPADDDDVCRLGVKTATAGSDEWSPEQWGALIDEAIDAWNRHADDIRSARADQARRARALRQAITDAAG